MSNTDSGFVKIYRSFFDHFLWEEEREYSKAEAWIDLIRTARYKEGTKTKMINGNLVEWDRGELLASVRFLKDRWNWNSTGKVTRFLDLLEKQNMIVRKTEQGVTVVSVCNYSTYNDLENDNRTATERKQNSDRTVTEQQQGQNSKKDKKVKKGKECSVGTNGTDFPQACEFIEEAKDVASYLENAICEYDPTHRYKSNPPSLNSWVLDIERAIRLDGRTKEQLKFIIDYIYRHNGKHSGFWAGNIESGKKLRKQFDKIKNQIREERKNGQQRNKQTIKSTVDSLYR